jgi:hypothetical protein
LQTLPVTVGDDHVALLADSMVKALCDGGIVKA